MLQTCFVLKLTQLPSAPTGNEMTLMVKETASQITLPPSSHRGSAPPCGGPNCHRHCPGHHSLGCSSGHDSQGEPAAWSSGSTGMPPVSVSSNTFTSFKPNSQGINGPLSNGSSAWCGNRRRLKFVIGFLGYLQYVSFIWQ
jgi:hypothetical protein